MKDKKSNELIEIQNSIRNLNYRIDQFTKDDIIQDEEIRRNKKDIVTLEINWWMLFLSIVIIAIFVSIFYQYYMPHKVCHDEVTTSKIELPQMYGCNAVASYYDKPYCSNSFGSMQIFDSNSQITCTKGVTIDKEQGVVYSDGTENSTCIVTTNKKVCEVK